MSEELLRGVFVTIFLVLFVSALLKEYLDKLAVNIKRKRLVSMNMSAIDRMDGLEFERYLEALFYKRGYKSLVTKSSHDFGADLLMKSGNKKIVIQAKRYKNRVGVDSVMQVYSAKGYYDADEAYVFTNSYFTKNAKELAMKLNVTLCDRDAIVRLRDKFE